MRNKSFRTSARVFILSLTMIIAVLFNGCGINTLESQVRFFKQTNIDLTEEEIEAWAAGCSAILAVRNGGDPLVFGTMEKNEMNAFFAKGLLSDSWGIYGRDDLLRTIITMTDDGHNSMFAKDYEIVSSMSDSEYEELLKESVGIDVYMWPLVKKIGDYWGDKQIKAWDWFRMIHVAGWGYVAGYIERQEAYALMVPVIERIRGTFSSWEEANDNYMDGFAWYSRTDITDSGSSYEYRFRMDIYRLLKEQNPEKNYFDHTLWPDYDPDAEYFIPKEEDIVREPSSGNFTYLDNRDGTCMITGYIEESGEIIIPREINGLKVTMIGENAFIRAKGFSGALAIPDTVEVIGHSAFYECTGLTGELILPGSITKIEKSAFGRCTGFEGTLNLPSGLTSISDYVFHGCSGFTGALEIPEGVTEIGSEAFKKCTGLTGELNIPEGVVSIGFSAFEECGFTGELNLPESLETIGNKAFKNCEGFTGTLEIKGRLREIGNNVFLGAKGIICIETAEDNEYFSSEDGILFNKNMTELVCVPQGIILDNYIIPVDVRSIRTGAFQDCSEITGRLVIPDRVELISNSTFSGCGGLSEIKLPHSLKMIKALAFNECFGLTIITIPGGVIEIVSGAFRRCENLREVRFLGNAPEQINDSVFKECTPDLTIYYDPSKKGFDTPEWLGQPCFPMK